MKTTIPGQRRVKYFAKTILINNKNQHNNQHNKNKKQKL